MAEPFYTPVVRVLHVGGGWLAFGVAPVALLALKGSRRHVVAGRCFLLAMTTGITAGLVLAAFDHAVGLFFFGLLALSFLGTGYLAPRIGRGSLRAYHWDRALTAVGAVGSFALICDSLNGMTSPWTGLGFGGLGLAIAVTHARWRGPRDPSRWRVEHLTSLVAAYTVVWSFILGLYVRALPERTHLVVPLLGLLGILWARRHFGRAAKDRDDVAPACS